MDKKCVFILSVSSDIGHALALKYLNDGYQIIGTYRNKKSVGDLIKDPEMHLIHCDIAYPESVESMIFAYRALKKPWDIFISCVGDLKPIKPFFSPNFDSWEDSIIINSIAQLRVLHGLYSFKRPEKISNVVFFSGGGTNNPFTNYSAYSASKLLLIKMCELLDDECSDLNVFIIGPGFLPTKIHQLPVQEKSGASYEDIYDCINWCIAKDKNITSGRNFSVVHDPWRNDAELVLQLLGDKNKFKIRRYRNKEA